MEKHCAPPYFVLHKRIIFVPQPVFGIFLTVSREAEEWLRRCHFCSECRNFDDCLKFCCAVSRFKMMYSGGPLSGNLFCIHFLALVLGTRFAPFNSACMEAMLKPH